jgi:hypothetical protein
LQKSVDMVVWDEGAEKMWVLLYYLKRLKWFLILPSTIRFVVFGRPIYLRPSIAKGKPEIPRQKSRSRNQASFSNSLSEIDEEGIGGCTIDSSRATMTAPIPPRPRRPRTLAVRDTAISTHSSLVQP